MELPETIRVLLVEDGPSDAKLLKESLRGHSRPHYEFVWVDRMQDALEALQAGRFEVALLDLALPDSTGTATITRLRDYAPGLPVVVLTGVPDERSGLEAIRLGVQDYLVKGEADGKTVARAIRYAIERQAMEAELREKRLQLEELVRYQTEELSGTRTSLNRVNRERIRVERALEDQLRYAREMKMLGQLTSGVAHEVRNPLNGIQAIMGALFKELGDSERFDPYLQHMNRQVTRLTTLMEDLLALGRPVLEEKKRVIPVLPFIRNTLSNWQYANPRSGPVQLRLAPETSESCSIFADGARIEQALINLLDNALQHSPPDKALRVAVEKAEAKRVRISIADSGQGIPEAHRDRIFEPFFSTRKGGTGLGLCIVRQIVEGHQGTVEAVDNRPDPGSTFIMTLPLM